MNLTKITLSLILSCALLGLTLLAGGGRDAESAGEVPVAEASPAVRAEETAALPEQSAETRPAADPDPSQDEPGDVLEGPISR